MRRQGIRKSAYDAIVEAAIEIIGHSPDASLSQVAEAAGVGRATLHRYFASRNTLLNAIALRAVEEIDAAIEAVYESQPSGEEELIRILEAIVPLGDRFHLLAKVAPSCTDPEVEAAYNRQHQASLTFVARMQKSGVFADDLPPGWIAQVLDYLTYAAWSSVAEGEVAPRGVAKLLHRTLVSGLQHPQ